ncbi:MAG: hypothetical protein KDA46_14600 [Parvularculaceae bacterium]|nr:hypothetical protein [Parvularculaceae bacterium]
MALVVFIVFFAVGIFLRERVLADPDTGWHIAAGDLIRDAGALPHTDPWSYTAGDQPWYNLSWGYDVALSLVHQWGGLPAVVVMTVLLYAAAVAFVAALALKSSRSVIAAMIAACAAGALLASGLLARPQLVSFLLALGVYALARFGSPRQLWAIPILMIVWANAHGAFLSGFVIIGMFFVEAAAARDVARAKSLALIGVAAIAALFANPYGVGVVAATQLTMASVLKPYLIEWRSTDLGLNPASFYLAALVAVWGFFDRRIPLADRLLAAFWIAVGLTSARMMQMTALLAAPYFAQSLVLRLSQTPAAAAIAARDKSYTDDLARPLVRRALAISAAAGVILVSVPGVQRALAGGGDFAAMRASITPAAAMSFLDAHYPGARIYNQYDFGGWMAFARRGAPAVFFDGRADTAYPREVLKDGVILGLMAPLADPAQGATAQFNEAQFDEASWRALTEKYRIDAFVLATPAPLCDVLGDLAGWTAVYDDATARVFVRADLAAASGPRRGPGED